MKIRSVLFVFGGVFFAGIAVAFLLSQFAFGTQPLRGHEAVAWELLGGIETVDTSDDIIPNLVKTFPEDLRAATDNFEIEGYLMRFVSEPYLQEFMLLPDPPECPFCGGSGYGPFLEVRMAAALGDLPNYSKLKVRGTLELIDDPKVYDSVRLVDAIIIE